tara:strand:- start:606 stop:827 length:222 start_codon:yes stop_codon:yes gene_type:complete
VSFLHTPNPFTLHREQPTPSPVNADFQCVKKWSDLPVFCSFFLRKPLKTSISNPHFLFTFPQNALLIHAFAFF